MGWRGETKRVGGKTTEQQVTLGERAAHMALCGSKPD